MCAIGTVHPPGAKPLWGVQHICIDIGSDRKPIPVSIPDGLVDELDKLVAEGKFGSRSEALRYGARLVARKSQLKRLHEETARRAKQDVEDRLERNRVR